MKADAGSSIQYARPSGGPQSRHTKALGDAICVNEVVQGKEVMDWRLPRPEALHAVTSPAMVLTP